MLCLWQEKVIYLSQDYLTELLIDKSRTAIEDELEVLYDAYYEELEQYANHQQQTRFYSTADGALTENNYEGGSPVSYEEGYDGQLDEDDDEEDDDDYSHAYDDDINSQSDQSDNLSEGEKSSYDEPSFPDRLSQNTAAGVDHFNFGNSLTVKGKASFHFLYSVLLHSYILQRRYSDSSRRPVKE